MLQRLNTTDRAENRTTEGLGLPDERHVPPPTRPRLELSIPKVLAGALAAASAAVAASWLGVAGTVVGAVVASVIVSVTSALYAHPLERSSQVIREVIPVAPSRYRESDAAGTTETLVIDRGDAETLREARSTAAVALDDKPRPNIRWATVALSAVVMLVVGFALLTCVEAVVGKPVSALGGNGDTTLSHLVHHSSSNSSDNGDSTKPSDGGPTTDGSTGSPTTGATDSPTTGAPTTDDPTTGEPTQTEPTPTEPTDGGATTGGPTGADEGAVGATP